MRRRAATVAALISVGVSAGVFFALLKLLPLFEDQLEVIAAIGAVTFLFSNLIGLRQTKAQRLLGYSSIGQMGLLTMAAALLLSAWMPKPRFCWWSAGCSSITCSPRPDCSGSPVMSARSVSRTGRVSPAHALVIVVFGDASSSRFPACRRFPGFWAKWQLVLKLARASAMSGSRLILIGSLLEAAYLFRWFGHAVHASAGTSAQPRRRRRLAADRRRGAPAGGQRLRCRRHRGPRRALDVLAARRRSCLCACSTGCLGGSKASWRSRSCWSAGIWLIRDLSGLNHLFAVLLLCRRLVVSIACLYRTDAAARLLSAARGHAAVAAGAAARLDQPRILLRLGDDHAVLLFSDPARARGRAACAALPAVLAGVAPFSCCWDLR